MVASKPRGLFTLFALLALALPATVSARPTRVQNPSVNPSPGAVVIDLGAPKAAPTKPAPSLNALDAYATDTHPEAPLSLAEPHALGNGLVQIGSMVVPQEMLDGADMVPNAASTIGAQVGPLAGGGGAPDINEICAFPEEVPPGIYDYDARPGGETPRHATVYLNYVGATMSSSGENAAEDLSRIARTGHPYPVYSGGEMRAIAAAQAVAADFEDWAVRIVYEVRPPKVLPYTMVMMGGDYSDTTAGPSGGVAPLDGEDFGQRNVCYMFLPGSPAVQQANVANQEIGHTLGLGHANASDSVMASGYAPTQGGDLGSNDSCADTIAVSGQGAAWHRGRRAATAACPMPTRQEHPPPRLPRAARTWSNPRLRPPAPRRPQRRARAGRIIQVDPWDDFGGYGWQQTLEDAQTGKNSRWPSTTTVAGVQTDRSPRRRVPGDRDGRRPRRPHHHRRDRVDRGQRCGGLTGGDESGGDSSGDGASSGATERASSGGSPRHLRRHDGRRRHRRKQRGPRRRGWRRRVRMPSQRPRQGHSAAPRAAGPAWTATPQLFVRGRIVAQIRCLIGHEICSPPSGDPRHHARRALLRDRRFRQRLRRRIGRRRHGHSRTRHAHPCHAGHRDRLRRRHHGRTTSGVDTGGSTAGACDPSQVCGEACCEADEACDDNGAVASTAAPTILAVTRVATQPAASRVTWASASSRGPWCSAAACATEVGSERGDGEVCDPNSANACPTSPTPSCAFEPEVGVFDPVPRFSWGVRQERACDLGCQTEEVCNVASGLCEPTWPHIEVAKDDFPEFHQCVMTPQVADLDGDCVPEIIFNTYQNSAYTGNGILRAIRGDTGQPLWTLGDEAYRTDPGSHPAIGDINGDGIPEVITEATSNALIAVRGDTGAVLWMSENHNNGGVSGAPSIANFDNAGNPEIAFGHTLYDANGVILFEAPASDATGTNGIGPISCVADLTGDGRPELIAGATVYTFTGTVGVDFAATTLWQGTPADGYCGIADFDGDGMPEVVTVRSNAITIFNGQSGATMASATIPGGGAGGPPHRRLRRRRHPRHRHGGRQQLRRRPVERDRGPRRVVERRDPRRQLPAHRVLRVFTSTATVVLR